MLDYRPSSYNMSVHQGNLVLLYNRCWRLGCKPSSHNKYVLRGNSVTHYSKCSRLGCKPLSHNMTDCQENSIHRYSMFWHSGHTVSNHTKLQEKKRSVHNNKIKIITFGHWKINIYRLVKLKKNYDVNKNLGSQEHLTVRLAITRIFNIWNFVSLFWYSNGPCWPINTNDMGSSLDTHMHVIVCWSFHR